MTSSNKTLAELIINFSHNYCQLHVEKLGHLPLVEHDKQWLSPCEVATHDETHHLWQAVTVKSARTNDEEELSFSNVESALNLTLHQDIKTYFTTIFSSDIEAQCVEGKLTLLFAWNKDDFGRLQENIIGHILMKQKLKQTETVFFAVTDEEDMIISIDNNSGEVWVEQVGCKPHKKLSDTLAQFIEQLTPAIPSID